MAVANYASNTITLYGLPSGDEIVTFGSRGSGCGQFGSPARLTFAGSDHTQLLISEWENRRLQEVTLTGEHIRFLAPGRYETGFNGVTTNNVVVAAVLPRDPEHKIVVLDYVSGDVLTAFGRDGSQPGHLSLCGGVKISADGLQVFVAECDNKRVSVFTIGGDFQRIIQDTSLMNDPSDVCVTEFGEVVVANNCGHDILVLPLDSQSNESSVTTRIGSGESGVVDGMFTYPAHVCMAGNTLFVLDWGSNRVQLFD